MAPIFVGYVDAHQEVNLNDEHSDYRWLSINEAIDSVSLPGNDEVLLSIERHFIKKNLLTICELKEYEKHGSWREIR